MARMSIPKVMEAYTQEDTAGHKYGMRAFSKLSREDLLSTTRNFVKYENKRIRSLIDKGYVTPAVISYAKRGGRYDEKVAGSIKAMYGREAYLEYMRRASTIYVKEYDSDSILRDKLAAAIYFKQSKTSTIRGEKAYRKKANETLRRNYNIKMSKYSKEEQEDFWDKLNAMADEGGSFGSRWHNNTGSPEIMQMIAYYVNNEDMSPAEALDRVYNYYNDLSEEGLRNAAEAFEKAGVRKDDFSTFENLLDMVEAQNTADTYAEIEKFDDLTWR